MGARQMWSESRTHRCDTMDINSARDMVGDIEMENARLGVQSGDDL